LEGGAVAFCDVELEHPLTSKTVRKQYKEDEEANEAKEGKGDEEGEKDNKEGVFSDTYIYTY